MANHHYFPERHLRNMIDPIEPDVRLAVFDIMGWLDRVSSRVALEETCWLFAQNRNLERDIKALSWHHGVKYVNDETKDVTCEQSADFIRQCALVQNTFSGFIIAGSDGDFALRMRRIYSSIAAERAANGQEPLTLLLQQSDLLPAPRLGIFRVDGDNWPCRADGQLVEANSVDAMWGRCMYYNHEASRNLMYVKAVASLVQMSHMSPHAFLLRVCAKTSKNHLFACH